MNWGKYLPRRNKYRNIKVTVNGIEFDSKAESLFYLHLLSGQQKGVIEDLECQPVIKFPDGTKMIPDFKAKVEGEIVYYDVKSPITRKTAVYRLKKKLLLYFFPDVIFYEVTRQRGKWILTGVSRKGKSNGRARES